jgi:ABC-type branched-subunit amino acid transport system substrate-binding protein
MAMFAENQATAQTEGLAQKAAMEAVGFKFIYSEMSVEPTQTDFSSEVQTMKADGVKGLVFQAPGSTVGDMAKAMYQAGFSVPFANWGGPAYDPQFITSGGPGANGAVLDLPTAMFGGEDAGSVPEVALFDKWYRALYNTTPDLYAAYGWMSGMLFVQGINAGGAPTRTALAGGLRTITSFNAGGLSGVDNPAGKKPPLCYIVIDVSNGRFVRDPSDPASGFRCDAGARWYYGHG